MNHQGKLQMCLSYRFINWFDILVSCFHLCVVWCACQCIQVYMSACVWMCVCMYGCVCECVCVCVCVCVWKGGSAGACLCLLCVITYLTYAPSFCFLGSLVDFVLVGDWASGRKSAGTLCCLCVWRCNMFYGKRRSFSWHLWSKTVLWNNVNKIRYTKVDYYNLTDCTTCCI